MSPFEQLLAWWKRRRSQPSTGAAVEPLPLAVAADDGPVQSVKAAQEVVGAGTPSVRDAVVPDGRSSERPQVDAPVPPWNGKIRLALQGGGSHGAFTWGVLDRLLEEESLDIDAVSGTSAGALNAAVLATGWMRGGREGAREALSGFWHDVGHAGALFSLFPLPNGQASALGFDALPGYDWGNNFLRTLSPYEFNPLNLNPLREVLSRHVGLAALHEGDIRLFVTATAVQSGLPRVFHGKELGIDALLASACLPFLFQTVEIEGEPYWDGGYSSNPSLYSLIGKHGDCDIIVVRINPARREGTPRRSSEIMDRVNEISFNASLIGELRAIAFVNRLLRKGELSSDRYRELRLHMIADDVDLAALPSSSKLKVDMVFLETLRGFGRAAAARFLDQHREALGRHSSVDVETEFPFH